MDLERQQRRIMNQLSRQLLEGGISVNRPSEIWETLQQSRFSDSIFFLMKNDFFLFNHITSKPKGIFSQNVLISTINSCSAYYQVSFNGQ